MSGKISKRFFLGAALSALGTAGFGKTLRPVLRPGSGAGGGVPVKAPPRPVLLSAPEIVREAQLGGKVAYAVADARTGKILESGNGGLGQPPASVAKAVTAAYALSTLGAEHRFFTDVMINGRVSGGVLKGDLSLRGGGDPTLDTDRLAQLAAQLKARGITAVAGKFIVDGSALPSIHEIDKDQPDHVGYNPAISGLMLNFNRVHFEWKRGQGGWQTSMEARSERHRPKVRFASMQIVGRELPVYSYAARGGRDIWTVSAKALGKGGSRWLPVRQPEIYAGEVFQALCAAQGVRLPAPQKGRAKGKVLLRQQSDDLYRICRDFLKWSNNLMAESVGLAATMARKGKVASLKASGAEMSRFAARSLNMGKSAFVDHSGLGEKSRVSALDMVQGMVKARGIIGPILKPIAMRDAKRRVIKGHPVKVNAKTGTLNFVSSLAGFERGPGGRELAFAIFAADMGARSKIKRGDRERPRGAKSWNRRAKAMQQKLIERWAAVYK